jgi:hypothetical protein
MNDRMDIDKLRADFPKWTVSFEYGYYTAYHSNYDASWEGEEDGWVDNDMKCSARTILELRDELKEKEAEYAK